MITLRHYHLDTRFRPVRRKVPGMDEPRWVNIDVENEITDGVDKRREIDADLRTFESNLQLAPWPESIPSKIWIDRTARYLDPVDGFNFRLHHFDQTDNTYHEIPAGAATFTYNPDPEVDRASGRIIPALEWPEIRDIYGPEYVRLEGLNETMARVNEPLVTQIQGLHRGARVALELPDNHILAPFDFRYPERYDAVYDDGTPLSPEELRQACLLHDGGSYRLYHRQRNWKWQYFFYAHYIYINFVEMYVLSIPFIESWWDKPPIYTPRRHDIFTTIDVDYVDAACLDQFDSSHAAERFRHEVMAQQYWSICEAQIFLNNDPGELTIWRDPEERMDTFLGLARYDRATGEETPIIWFRYAQSTSSRYPRAQIAHWQDVPWFVI